MTITRMAMVVAQMTMTAALAQAGQPQQKIAVGMLNRANAHVEVLLPAQALASQMFAQIGLSLDWNPRHPTGYYAGQPIVLELVTGTPLDFKPGALAYAMPYEGIHIVVLFDRVSDSPMRVTILAHVMVHEITHILEGVSRHSDTGVMKAHWTGADFCQMRGRPLAFAAEDVELIHIGLTVRLGAGGTLVATR